MYISIGDIPDSIITTPGMLEVKVSFNGSSLLSGDTVTIFDPNGYIDDNVVAAPKIIVVGTKLKMLCSTSGSTIYYTSDGSTPSATSTEYTVEIDIPQDVNTTYKAIAIKAGLDDSMVTTLVYSPDTGGIVYEDPWNNYDEAWGDKYIDDWR